MSNDKPLPGFEDRAPRDRYCDLILTGGVTSAVAYPGVIFGLARAYRFNCIGGSSSGAGCAAMAAAAEYRRRHGSGDGFRILLERTAALADERDGKTGLAWLFQPARDNKRLFDALLRGFAAPQNWIGVLLWDLVRTYAGVAMLAALAGAGLVAWLWTLTRQAGAAHVLFAVVLAIVVASIALVVAWYGAVARLADDDFGLCSGTSSGACNDPAPLTDWLHALLQEIAGRRAGDAPLTFADLAAAPGSPRETLGDESPAGAESISLQMFTANVTHGRPYLLPLSRNGPALYFRRSEMQRLFPASVVEHMVLHAQPYAGSATIEEPPPAYRPWWQVWRARPQPRQRDKLLCVPTQQLPVIVAARMSISFPVLFSAVPLWALDDADPAAPRMRRCLFSDGGICSNFPIHLFDSALPAWPTFGISMYERETPAFGPRDPDTRMTDAQIEASVKLPKHHLDGREEQWSSFAAQAQRKRRWFGFFGAVASTAKDWNDNTLARLPGVRDRVARVHLEPTVGGLNVLMSSTQIEDLARLGGEAARRLLERFSLACGSSGIAAGWNEHRWVRFNVLRECLSSSLAGLGRSAQSAPYAQPLAHHIRDAIDNAPLEQGPRSPTLLDAQAAALQGALAALLQAENALTAPAAQQPYEPHPQPVMRARPVL